MKPIVTLNPKLQSLEEVTRLPHSGIHHFRCNLGRHRAEDYLPLIVALRREDSQAWVFVDLPGRKGRIQDGAPRSLCRGEPVVLLLSSPTAALNDRIRVQGTFLRRSIATGMRLEIIGSHGAVALTVCSVEGSEVCCSADSDGSIQLGDGVVCRAIFQGSEPHFTEEDLIAIGESSELRPDCISVSFCENAESAAELRKLADQYLGYVPLIGCKIETPIGVRRAPEIADAADLMIVGRGDLALWYSRTNIERVVQHVVDSIVGPELVVATGYFSQLVERSVSSPSGPGSDFAALPADRLSYIICDETAFAPNWLEIAEFAVQACAKATSIDE
jgi:pyruvate kinase